jgi:ubiquinone/menaquinone biosynthesis C-methylase UbiE
MRRVIVPELLDDDLGTPAEIAQSLRDLQRINDWFGGTRTTIGLLRRVAERSGSQALSLLEVGAGDGHVSIIARKQLARHRIELGVTLLDRVASHLPQPEPGVAAVAGDAMQLPFRDGAFDVVACNLVAHHFNPEELEGFAREALRVTRLAVVINDLIRSRLHLALCYAGLPLFRSRITWHDAPASVRQAYTVEEMRRTLSRTNARQIDSSRHYLYRMGILLWK